LNEVTLMLITTPSLLASLGFAAGGGSAQRRT
jgi:hypothetical protein